MKRENCFDALRLLLAALVIYGHSHLLGGFIDPMVTLSKGQVHPESDAVLGFFGISGYLITASRYRSSSFWSYLAKRVRRIFPGFWACLAVTAFGVAPAMYFLRSRELATFPWNDAWHFVWHNSRLVIHQFSVGNVLVGNPYTGSINGSLWTLWPEFTCYLMVAAIAYLGSDRALGATLIGLVAIHILALSHAPVSLPAILALSGWTRLYLAFAVGACLYLWPKWVMDRRGLVFIALALTALARNGGYELASPMLIPWLLISVGESFKLQLPVDLSYGTYLYGFAVQQLVIAALPHVGWPAYFLITLAASLAAGWVSWTLVERHFVRR